MRGPADKIDGACQDGGAAEPAEQKRIFDMSGGRNLLMQCVLAGSAAIACPADYARAGRICDESCDAMTCGPCDSRSSTAYASPYMQDGVPSGVESQYPQQVFDDSTSSVMNSDVLGTGDAGGFGDLNLVSGSTSGDTFAAFAPGTYIDNAIIADMFRFRFDAAYNSQLPDRAEFFYPAYNVNGLGTGLGGGLGVVDPEINYQEFRPYFERALSRRFSLFFEAPVRLLNPDLNPNTGGFSDIQTGFKAGLYDDGCEYLTAQLRVYAPTGDGDRGLGTGHTSIEPGLLYLGRLSDRLVVQGESAVWVPIDGSQDAQGRDFAGPVLRYGIGGGYDLLKLDSRCQRRRLTSTLEAVGWTVTDGLATDPNDIQNPIDVSGDTIVNIKSGLRYTAGRRSIAAGYGVAVTGDRWYSDIVRLELRTLF